LQWDILGGFGKKSAIMKIEVEVRPGKKKAKVVPLDSLDESEAYPDSSGINFAKRYLVEIDAVAKENKANIRLIKILADYFKVSFNSVRFISGVKSRKKILEIDVG
jgi:uncharacterized protein YggU (UPF0235/DUF167 family)